MSRPYEHIAAIIEQLRVTGARLPASARPPSHVAGERGVAGYRRGCRCVDCRAGAAAARRRFRAAARGVS